MRYAIVTDLNRCIGCLSCSVACKMENNIPIGSFNIKVDRIGPTPKQEGSRFPDVEMYFLPLMCQHCEEPQCVLVCPSEALYKAADGAVLLDSEKCDGCEACIDACPYGLVYFNPRENVAGKCDLCHHRVVRGQVPACVSQCVGRALAFGDLDDPDSPVSAMIADAGKNVYSLSDSGSNPTFRYILRNATWRGIASD